MQNDTPAPAELLPVTQAVRFDGSALGARIKMLRNIREMTLQQVADAAGLTKSHVWELEQGRSSNPSVNAVWGMASALCVSPAMLLGLDDKMPPIDPVALRIAGIVDREIKRAVRGEADRLRGILDKHGISYDD